VFALIELNALLPGDEIIYNHHLLHQIAQRHPASSECESTGGGASGAGVKGTGH
jgi:hypothetical protein